MKEVIEKCASLLALSRLSDEAGGSVKKRAKASAKLKAQLPLMANYPTSALGSVSEAFCDSLLAFIDSNPNDVLSVKRAVVLNDPAAGASDKERRKAMRRAEKEANEKADEDAKETFMQLMQLKFMRCQVASGEAVGVLAAQSVGEFDLVPLALVLCPLNSIPSLIVLPFHPVTCTIYGCHPPLSHRLLTRLLSC